MNTPISAGIDLHSQSIVITIDGTTREYPLEVNQLGSLDFWNSIGPCAIVKASPESPEVLGRLALCRNLGAPLSIGAIIDRVLVRDAIVVRWASF